MITEFDSKFIWLQSKGVWKMKAGYSKRDFTKKKGGGRKQQ